jgi:hypothetical protein
MKSGAQVMDNMIPVIPATFIKRRINTVYGIGKNVFRIVTVYKSMLRPVPDHHHQPGKQNRNYKYYQGCFQVYKTHDDTENIEYIFTCGKAQVHFFSLFPVQVLHRVPDTQYQKIKEIKYKTPDTVPLIAHSAASVFR